MAGFELNLKVNNKQLRRANRKLSKAFRQPNRLLKKIGKEEVENAEQRIRRTKRSPDGVFWQPWSYATLRSRQRRGTVPTGLLYESGTLYKGLNYKVRGRSLTIGNSVNYAEFLQVGTNNMPARPFLGWSKQSEKAIGKMLSNEIRRLWR